MTKNTRYLLYFNNYTASSLVDKMPLFSNYCLDALAACVVTHTHTHTYIYIYIYVYLNVQNVMPLHVTHTVLKQNFCVQTPKRNFQ